MPHLRKLYQQHVDLPEILENSRLDTTVELLRKEYYHMFSSTFFSRASIDSIAQHLPRFASSWRNISAR